MLNHKIFTTKAGLKIAYITEGDVSNPVILFCHGLGTCGLQFKAQIERLKSTHYVIAPDLRGHANSGLPDQNVKAPFLLKNYAQDVLELTDFLKIKNLIWVGNSVGGLIGIELLKLAPSRINRLITFGTTYSLSSSRWLFFIAKTIYKIMGSWLSKVAAPSLGKTSEQKQFLKQIFKNNHNIVLSETLNDIENYTYIDFLKTVSIPITVIKSQNDKQVNAALTETEQLINQSNNMNIIQLNNAGHIANIDVPDAFNQILLKILNINNA